MKCNSSYEQQIITLGYCSVELDFEELLVPSVFDSAMDIFLGLEFSVLYWFD